MKTAFKIGCGILVALFVLFVVAGAIWWKVTDKQMAKTLAENEQRLKDKGITVVSAPQSSSPSAPSAFGKWRVTKQTSALSDSAAVSASLPAEKEISGWPSTTTTPHIIIRCNDKKLEANIVNGMSPNIEGSDDTYTMIFRFDQDAPFKARGGKSTDGDALFIPDAKSFLAKIEDHAMLAYGFTPFESSPVETTFNLVGSAEALKGIHEACPDTGKRK